MLDVAIRRTSATLLRSRRSSVPPRPEAAWPDVLRPYSGQGVSGQTIRSIGGPWQPQGLGGSGGTGAGCGGETSIDSTLAPREFFATSDLSLLPPAWRPAQNFTWPRCRPR